MKKFTPERSSVWKDSFITYRRLWLDSCLTAYSAEMRGVVIDLGGKRENKRGSFHPPEEQAKSWWYVNLASITHPDIFADVSQVPIEAQCVDCVICTEVLEHLPNPQACVDEIRRILRRGGAAYVSVPFMYPVHADPYDFQRFTDEGLRRLFSDFKSVEIVQMGSYPGVIGMLIDIGIDGIHGTSLFTIIIRRGLRWISRWLCSFDLHTLGGNNLIWQKYTTGYFLKAVR